MKFTFATILLLSFSIASFSQKSKDVAKATERASGTVKVFQQFIELGKESLPVTLFKKAKAIAIFPDTSKVTIMLSQLTVGRGLASVRLADGWSVPAFVTLKGNDMKLKIAGKKSFDVIVLLMDDNALKGLQEGFVGSDGGKAKDIMQGPVVEGPGSEEIVGKKSAIYYILDNGQLVDFDLANNAYMGAFYISLDNDMNKSIFGVKAKELFVTSTREAKQVADIDKFRTSLVEALPKQESQPKPNGEPNNEP